MTTTLTNAGGNSLVTDGTGPTLQIKGLADGVGTKVVPTATTSGFRLKTIGEMQKFADDFYYHTNGTTVDINNAASPFMKSSIWYINNLSGPGITQVQQWPGGGPGVLQFNNNVRTGSGAWRLTASNTSFSVGGGAELSFETMVYFDTPSSNSWYVDFGFISSDGFVTGFTISPGYWSNIMATTVGTGVDTSVTVASMYGAWTLLKFVVDSTGSSVKFYINGTLVVTGGAPSDTYYLPHIYTSRSASITTFSYYVDYVEVIRDKR